VIYNACITNKEERNECETLLGKSERRIPIGRPKRRLVDNIKFDIKRIELGWQ
jgi:hypothetical protein